MGFFFFNHEKLKQADAKGAAYNERTVEKQLPRRDCSAEERIAASMKIGNRKIRFAGEYVDCREQESR